MSRKKYYELFSVVEVQETFYNIPSLSKLEKWRSEAPTSFEFTVKAWQVITHPKNSPTWRRLKNKPEGDLLNYGFLKPTKENLNAWSKVLDVAYALKSRIIVLQLPPSLELTEKTYNDISKFLSKAVREDLTIVVEPRNETWHQNPGMVERLFKKYGVVHCVDIFKRTPLSTGSIYYFRLHGLNGEINYKYRYTDEDLEALREKIGGLGDSRDVYILFNNIYMFESATKFLNYID